MADLLSNILKKADVAEYSWDGYYVYVRDEQLDGYSIAICKEALPPHVTKDVNTLDEAEEFLDGTLNYDRGTAVWEASEPEV